MQTNELNLNRIYHPLLQSVWSHTKDKYLESRSGGSTGTHMLILVVEIVLITWKKLS